MAWKTASQLKNIWLFERNLLSESCLNIRAAASRDLEAMSELLKELFSLEADFSFERSRQQKGLELMLSQGAARLLVAEEAGRVIGMCSGQVVVSTAEGGPSVLVEDLVVREDWRGKGVGKKLLHALYEWSRKQGASRLQLLADQDNESALSFYQHLSWQKTRLVCLRKLQ